jgi:hypothetical protein
MVLLVLVLIWLVVTLPIAVRKFSEFQLMSSVARFQHQTEMLGRTHVKFVGAGVRAPGSPPRAPVREIRARIEVQRTRRRETLLLLGSGICSTLLIGEVPELRAFWVVAVLLATITGVYLALLVRCAAAESAAAERARKVVALSVGPRNALFEQERRVIAAGGGGHVVVAPDAEFSRPHLVGPDGPD